MEQHSKAVYQSRGSHNNTYISYVRDVIAKSQGANKNRDMKHVQIAFETIR